jgi:two-component system response regulator
MGEGIIYRKGKEESKMVTNEVEILLVEDNPNDVELTLRALKKNNLTNKVHVVKDGAEALEYIFATGAYASRDSNNNPKVILLDLKLPKVDGLEVLRQIKSNERTKMIPVVVLTSSKEERDLVESYKLGANSFITKPVDFESFVKAVKELGLYWLLLNQSPR